MRTAHLFQRIENFSVNNQVVSSSIFEDGKQNECRM